MNALLHAIGILLFRVGAAPLVRWLNRNVPRVLAYHACEENESAFLRDLRCNTTPEVLQRQVDYLAAHYNVISLDRFEAGQLPPRTVLLTFDDGYRSVYEHAWPLLRARGMAATVYIVSCTSGGDRLIWVNELNWFLHAQSGATTAAATYLGLPTGTSATAIIARAQAGLSPQSIEELLADLANRFGVDRRALARDARLYLNAAEIDEMYRTGCTFGNHTYSHQNLAALSDAECRAEIAGGASSGERGLPVTIRRHPSLAYPFGLHTEAVRRAATELGAVPIMQIGGWNRPLDLTRVARIPVYATTEAGFFAELEVVHPIKALARRLIGMLSHSPARTRTAHA